MQDTLSSRAVLASPALRLSVRAISKDILRTRLDLVWRASVFARKITLLARTRSKGGTATRPSALAAIRCIIYKFRS